MNTEKATELLAQFKNNGVSQEPGPGLNSVLDYQDIIGRSNKADIVNFEESLNQDGRKNFIWCNFLTLSQDVAIDILKSTVIHRWLNKHADALEADYYKREETQNNNLQTFNDSKKTIDKKIRTLEKANARLEAENASYKKQCGYYSGQLTIKKKNN